MSRVGSFKITDDQDNKMPPSPIIQEKKPEKSITPAPSMKKTPTFSEKLKRIQDMPAPKKTPTIIGDKHFMNTADAKPETPKPKVFHPPQPPPPPPPPQVLHSPIRQTKPPAKPVTTETKADAWEREENRKIKERYIPSYQLCFNFIDI